MKKTVLIDTSSAILLFKSDWMIPLLNGYRVGTGPAAFQEMTVTGYPGARAFAHWQQKHQLTIHSPCAPDVTREKDLRRLDPGERECIRLYTRGMGTFIIIDDGPGAAYCRRKTIPYVNALLIPRLLSPGATANGAGVAAAIRKIYACGRYASWVLEYALSCPAEDLTFFLP